MVGWVHVLASFVIVVEEGLTFLDVSFREEKHSRLAIYLTAHRSHILLQSLGPDLTVVDSVEEPCHICEDIGHNHETCIEVSTAHQLHD